VNPQTKNKLNQLFNQFDNEEDGISSFALSNLLNRTLAIIKSEKEKSNNEEV
jgi:hypothetical protein